MQLLFNSNIILTFMSYLQSSPQTTIGPERTPVPTKLFTPTNYSIVQDIFIQSTPTFNSTNYDLLSDSFGLISKSPSRWSDLRAHIDNLNAQADDLTAYKVIYAARHGEGYHNVAEAKYGTREWDAYWSTLEGDGEIVWGPDPQLTPLGISQAEKVNAAWKVQMRDGVPLPLSLYSSPLSRAASTLNITWKDILIEPKGMRPLFREHLRETIGLHTCDKRKTKSYLATQYPSFNFEIPFNEHDQLWGPTYQEVDIQRNLRLQQVLDHLFATDPNPFVSFTAHSGAITSFLEVVKHRPISISPGGFVPVVVKAVGYPSATKDVYAGGVSATAPPRMTPTGRVA